MYLSGLLRRRGESPRSEAQPRITDIRAGSGPLLFACSGSTVSPPILEAPESSGESGSEQVLIQSLGGAARRTGNRAEAVGAEIPLRPACSTINQPNTLPPTRGPEREETNRPTSRRCEELVRTNPFYTPARGRLSTTKSHIFQSFRLCLGLRLSRRAGMFLSPGASLE